MNGDIGTSDYYQLYYSKDEANFVNFYNGYIYQLTNSGDTSKYTWTIPDFGNDSESQVRIRVLNSTRSVADTSNSYRVYYEPKVEIIAPSSGEFVLPATSKVISWKNGDTGTSDYFQLYYSKDGANFVNFYNGYIYQLTNSGDTSRYTWNVPNIESTDVKLRILNSTRAVADTTYSFSICTTCPALAIYTPNGGEVLAIGQNIEIGWNSGSTWVGTDNVKIDYSTDGGATFVSPAIFDGNYSELTENKITWMVPDTETTNGIVRVSNVTQGINDVSNAVFTITTPPTPPTDFTAVATLASGRVDFNWTDNATNETSYTLQYSSDKVSWLPWVSNLGANANSTSVTGVNNVGYWWRVEVSSSAFKAYSEEKFAGNFTTASRALTFDGVDDAVVIQDSSAFDFGTGDFTIEAWIKPNNLSTDHAIISDYNGSPNNSMTFFTNVNGGLSAYIGANAADLSSPDGVLEVGKWDHVALIRAADSAFLYINSARVSATSGLAARSLSSSFNLTIGSQPAGSPFYFNGAIDEVRIWNKAVGSVDLLSNYFSQLSGDEDGLVAYYQMNHTAGLVVGDRTPNNYNGTWMGSQSGSTAPSWVTSQALVDNLPPAVPSEFTIVNNGTSGLDFSWMDNAINETSYTVQYSTDKQSWFAWSNNLGVDASSFLISSIGNVGYWWRVAVSTSTFTTYSEELFVGRYTTAYRAISLDGSDDAIVVRDSTAFDFGTGDFTIEAWINSNDLTTTHGIISDFNNSAAGSMRLMTTPTGELAASIGSDVYDLKSPEGTLTLNKWDHIALTRAADSAFLYLNGSRVAATSGLVARSLNSDVNMTIGKQASGTGFNFKGQIDEVRIWNVAVSEEDLLARYYTQLNGDEAGLLAYYQMNHTSGTSIANKITKRIGADWTGASAGVTSPSWVTSGALVDNLPPANPSGFTISDNATTGLNFNWVDNAINETSYILQYSDNKVNWFSYSNNLGAGANSYVISNIGNTGYWWRVAVSSGTIITYSEELFAGRFTTAARALSFDGTDDAIVVRDSTAFDFGTGDFTIEAWINSNDLTTTHGIISDFNNSAAGSMRLMTTPTGELAASIGSDVYDLKSPEGTLTLNKWDHIALTRAADSAFLYLNGSRVAATSGLVARSLNSDVNMTIGKQASGTGFNFKGQIDEVRIWNVAVSEEDLLARYYTQLNGDEAGLLAYYQMNHTSGTSIANKITKRIGADWTGASAGVTSPSWVTSGALVDNLPPAAPTDFVIKDNGSNGLDFSWTDNATNEISYTIQSSSNKTTWSNWTNNLGVNASSSAISFSFNIGYWWRIAVSTGVNTTYSEEIYKGWFTNAGRALQFDGTDDQVQIDSIRHLDNTQNFTLEAWVFLNSLGAFDVLMGTGSSLTNRVDLQMDGGTGKLLAVVANGAEAYGESSRSLIVGKWYHVAMSYDGTGATNADRLKLYINGQEDNLTFSGTIPSSTGTMNAPYVLGSFNGSFPMEGSLDEVRLWSQTLSADSIFSNYLVQLEGDEEGLEGYYQLNHNGGSVISDQSVKDRKGVWTGPAGGFTTPRWISSQALIDNTPSVNITAPIAGAFWEVGTQQTITWNAVNFSSSDAIQVRLSTDGGLSSAILSQANSSSYFYVNQLHRYVFTVPDNVTTNAKIIVLNTTQNVSDTTDVFQIGTINRSIKLLSPNGGETLIRNQAVKVKFEIEGIISSDNISVYYSPNNGATFTDLIATGSLFQYPSDTSFIWGVNRAVTDNGLLRILVSNRGVADTTDAVFRIIEAPTAPEFQSLNATVIGDDYELSYSLSEAGTVYFVALADGNSIPSGEQIKAAATGTSTLAGQAAFGAFADQPVSQLMIQTGSASFVRQARYDFYFSAEDAEGELNPGRSLPNVIVQFTPFERDSIVIDNIYAQTAGANWENTAENWNELPIADRTEITVGQDRITGLDLSGKGIASTFPNTVTNLDSLRSLDLSDNQLTSIPNVSFMRALTFLDVSNNSLEFSRLLPNAQVFTSGDQYSPQALLLEKDSLAIRRGNNYTIAPAVFGEGNVYNWTVDYYNTFDKTFTELESVNSNILQINSLDFDNMGTYQLSVTNPALPALTLETGKIQLWATATLEMNVTGENNAPLAAGAAYALRNRGPGLPYDSIPKINGIQNPNGLAFTNGKAVFENLLLGEYLISIRADPTKYLPSYYSNTYLWEEADKLDFKADLVQTMKMVSVPPVLGPGDGDGDISGTIESDFADPEGEEGGRISSRRKVKKAVCSMRRFVRAGRTLQEEWELIAFVESDDEGRFQFDFIPAGTYRFNIEYPGIPMDPNSFVEFVIGEGGENVFVLEATITEDGVSVERIITLGFTELELDQFKVYPNPSTDRVFISSGNMESGLYVNLVSVSGGEVGRFEFRENGSPLEIDLREVKNGIYFLNVLDANDPKKKITYKIIVKH